jgi:hypothetical protein
MHEWKWVQKKCQIKESREKFKDDDVQNQEIKMKRCEYKVGTLRKTDRMNQKSIEKWIKTNEKIIMMWTGVQDDERNYVEDGKQAANESYRNKINAKQKTNGRGSVKIHKAQCECTYH